MITALRINGKRLVSYIKELRAIFYATTSNHENLVTNDGDYLVFGDED